MTGIIDSLLLLACYLLGGIPFSVIISKWFFNINIFEQGSGNPGATNILRTLGPKPAIAVLLLDMGKGVAAVGLASLVQRPFLYLISLHDMRAVCGALAILGHIYSPFLKFKGGKGVATATGVVFAISRPEIGVGIAIVFIGVLLISGYVSLGSIVSAFILPFLYPLTAYLCRWTYSPALEIFAIGLAALVIIKHKANIVRLIHGNENKFALKKKNRSE